MTKQELWQAADRGRIYLDGAAGSNLVKAGMPSGVCPEQWILEHREVMLELQKAYVEAGSNILYTPTFTANRIKLGEYGLAGRMEEMIHALVGITKEAAGGGNVLVAGDLTMTGEQLSPMGRMDFEELIDIYKQQIAYMAAAGVDLIAAETMMSIQEARAALIAAKEVCSLPVMVTMTFERDGRTLYGTDAVTAAVTLQSLGAAAVGANCSTGPAGMEKVIRSMAGAVTVPVIAKPNAGLPGLDRDGNTCYDMDAAAFAGEMRTLVEAGASMLGGCCGTSPEYIRLLRESLDPIPFQRRTGRPEGMRYLSGERRTVAFSLDQGFMVVGERINPTGKKKLQEQLREGNLELALRYAVEQEACGAQILDINMGMSGIDEKKMMLRAVQEVGETVDLPLSLDSSHIDVLEAALRRYPGRALVNSVSMEKEKYEKLLPIVAEYGAMFILLPLSDKGLPENLEEKKSIIRAIVDRALELGMSKEDIVVDGLVTTVGANRRAALETLETIRYCRQMGLATVCGLSNISFGMPERGFVNTAFLTLAIASGLTMAIANPSQELLMGGALAADLLIGKEDSDLRYIEFAGRVKEQREALEAQRARKAAAGPAGDVCVEAVSRGAADGQMAGTGRGATDSQITADGQSAARAGGNPAAAEERLAGKADVQPEEPAVRTELFNAVLKGNRKGIVSITKRALEEGEEPSLLLNEVLLPAINLVGDCFDRGKYFLPQLIAGAEAMKLSIEVLEPLLLKDSDEKDKPVVVIATVEGDIHDIGKNLVALMLKNYGFEVIDLGKDVPKEQILKEAKEHNASIIALSALMTTTMQRMREVVEAAKEQGVEAKIMIGGAVISQDYADEIGADGYSGDAAGAVKLAQRLLGEGGR